jgi:hypothetical protein
MVTANRSCATERTAPRQGFQRDAAQQQEAGNHGGE